MQKKIYAMGLDIYTDFSSISYLESLDGQPVAFGSGEESGKYVIPMALYKRRKTGDWLIGDDAMFAWENEAQDKEELITSAFTLYEKGQKKYVYGQEYDGENLLKIYLKELYMKVMQQLEIEGIQHLVITAENVDKKFIATMRDFFLQENIDDIRFLNHAEAFGYYVRNSKKELWVNDVTLFHLDKNQFVCQNFTRRKEKEKSTIIIKEQNLTDIISYDMLKNPVSAQVADEKFYQYLVDDYKKHIVSCVYFTGIGFYENWYQRSIQEICKKRRAFKGFNLYAEGACASMLMCRDTSITMFCKGRTWYEVGVYLEDGDDGKEHRLSEAAVNWNEAGSAVILIPDGIEVLRLSIRSVFQKNPEILEIDLQELPIRTDKTMCIGVSLEYEDDETFVVTVEDLGFGELIPSTGAMIRRKISLQ